MTNLRINAQAFVFALVAFLNGWILYSGEAEGPVLWLLGFTLAWLARGAFSEERPAVRATPAEPQPEHVVAGVQSMSIEDLFRIFGAIAEAHRRSCREQGCNFVPGLLAGMAVAMKATAEELRQFPKCVAEHEIERSRN